MTVPVPKAVCRPAAFLDEFSVDLFVREAPQQVCRPRLVDTWCEVVPHVADEVGDVPGDRTTPHRHPDSVMVTISDFDRRLTIGNQVRDVSPRSGLAAWLPAQTHMGENVGPSPTHVMFSSDPAGAGAGPTRESAAAPTTPLSTPRSRIHRAASTTGPDCYASVHRMLRAARHFSDFARRWAAVAPETWLGARFGVRGPDSHQTEVGSAAGICGRSSVRRPGLPEPGLSADARYLPIWDFWPYCPVGAEGRIGANTSGPRVSDAFSRGHLAGPARPGQNPRQSCLSLGVRGASFGWQSRSARCSAGSPSIYPR